MMTAVFTIVRLHAGVAASISSSDTSDFRRGRQRLQSLCHGEELWRRQPNKKPGLSAGQ
jgi:hypothetical protein